MGRFADEPLLSLSGQCLKQVNQLQLAPTGLVIAFDYEIVCQRAANDEELQLSVHTLKPNVSKTMRPESGLYHKRKLAELRKII